MHYYIGLITYIIACTQWRGKNVLFFMKVLYDGQFFKNIHNFKKNSYYCFPWQTWDYYYLILLNYRLKLKHR